MEESKAEFKFTGQIVCVCMKQNNITKPTSPVESNMHRSTKQCQRKQKNRSIKYNDKKKMFVWNRTIQFLTHLPNRISFRLERIRLRTQLHKLHFLPKIPTEIPQNTNTNPPRNHFAKPQNDTVRPSMLKPNNILNFTTSRDKKNAPETL